MVALDEAAQYFPLAEEVFLPDEFFECLRAQTLGKRLVCGALKETALPIHADAHLPCADYVTMDYLIKCKLRQ